MIGIDANVLARYYIRDDGDEESLEQQSAARRLIESGRPLMVCKTVLLEFEWVMRGFYEFPRKHVVVVMNHLLSLPQLTVEDRDTVSLAVAHCEAGLDFADAIHHASYRECASVVSFDDRRFARRALRLGLSPRVSIPE
jgi:predicted nucleic-acid-binding protein